MKELAHGHTAPAETQVQICVILEPMLSPLASLESRTKPTNAWLCGPRGVNSSLHL